MHVGGRGVARAPGVHHQDFAAGPGQHQGRGQAGGAPADDCYVVLIHVSRLATRGRIAYERCCFWENRVR